MQTWGGAMALRRVAFRAGVCEDPQAADHIQNAMRLQFIALLALASLRTLPRPAAAAVPQLSAASLICSNGEPFLVWDSLAARSPLGLRVSKGFERTAVAGLFSAFNEQAISNSGRGTFVEGATEPPAKP